MEFENLNDTQKRIYEYLLDRSRKTAVPASVREIGAAVGLRSTSSVQANLNYLEEAGYITRDPLLKRSIRLNVQDEAKNYHEIPLLGTVAAGAPILTAEQIEAYIPFGGPVSSDKELFALRVKGESMTNAGILEGDVIIVEKTPEAKNGEMVVALIDDEATVKTFYKEKDHFRLQPENDYMDPIICDELVILGKVVGLMRYY
ncbi:MAG: transcriptional repressor LexA [Clostridia bacterium]|nr:transcriptional repressor LexA [Clostridia bacterium]